MAFVQFVNYGKQSRKDITLRSNGRMFISYSMLQSAGFIDKSSMIYFDILFDYETNKVAMSTHKDKKCEKARLVVHEKTGITLNLRVFLTSIKVGVISKRKYFKMEIEDIDGVNHIAFNASKLISSNK